MKRLVLITGLVLLSVNTSFADNCASLAERTVVRKVAKIVAQRNTNISFMAFSRLMSKTSNSVSYQVELFATYNGGSSSEEFPSEFYEVTAKGNEDACTVSCVVQIK